MKRTTISTPLRFASISFAVVLCAAPFALSPPHSVFAQSKAPVQRVVEGKVVNKSDQILPGSVVYLKNTKSLAVRSFLTDDAGNFRFGQLSPSADFELWAEQNGKRSSTKSISSFNNKNDLVFTLKIDTEK